ncbi:hypothetical protein MUY35_00900 [Aliiroseovarius sp. S1339]|uniref:hypothetical protein n=1 Tax=Aliiroseovarius sp. S1339 TaxID=2936990 RepID=UPI0020BD8FD4|nr:hypothetical protein [Aliiroseovarius sp. S1339]MCK8462403.1 hypothetical protein [Aliiroseovarius sp. S1339]
MARDGKSMATVPKKFPLNQCCDGNDGSDGKCIEIFLNSNLSDIIGTHIHTQTVTGSHRSHRSHRGVEIRGFSLNIQPSPAIAGMTHDCQTASAGAAHDANKILLRDYHFS